MGFMVIDFLFGKSHGYWVGVILSFEFFECGDGGAFIFFFGSCNTGIVLKEPVFFSGWEKNVVECWILNNGLSLSLSPYTYVCLSLLKKWMYVFILQYVCMYLFWKFGMNWGDSLYCALFSSVWAGELKNEIKFGFWVLGVWWFYLFIYFIIC